MSKKWKNFTKEQLEEIIYSSSKYSEALEKIGYATYSTNNKIIKEICEYYNFTLDHFVGTTIKDLTGQKFGRLLVLERDESYPKGHQKKVYWKCMCDCGKQTSVCTQQLLKGASQSCGCLRVERLREKIKLDLTGKTFGKLTVIKEVEPIIESSGQIRSAWECICECGNKCIVKTINLQSGDTKSCGCLKSKGELKIANILKENNINYKSQFSFPDLKGDRNVLLFDFAIFDELNSLKYLIEYQGLQHYQVVEYFGGKEGLLKRQQYDNKKVEYCDSHKIPLIILNGNNTLSKEEIIKEDLLYDRKLDNR